MAAAAPPPSYHRGDPLDIPLIDHHLLVHMLCPRITSAIRYAFPQLYLDWTTGVTAAEDDSASQSNPFLRKRWVEMLLHTSLLLGSYHFGGKGRDSSYLATPAMKNLGMILRPAATDNNHHHSRPSRIKVYSKIVALVLATVVVPALYEELKLRRQKQLERQETRLRLAQLHQEFETTFETSNSNSTNIGQQQNNQDTMRQHCQEGNVMQQRALRRRKFIQRLLVDSILGMSDILIPPLRLITYVSYLWGLCPTPNFGSTVIGWEYASVNDIQGNSEGESLSIISTNQRHANFQYGNRRLMVEEGLRTMAAILPPRSNSSVQTEGDTGQIRRSTEDALNNEDDYRLSTNAPPQMPPGGRRGWMRQRALSFMGVVEEEKEESEQQRAHGNDYDLNCALCQTVPAIPYITSCGHCYCYLCLRMAVTEDPYYRCVCCRKRIETSSRPTIKK